jgi:flagellar protein FlgJ
LGGERRQPAGAPVSPEIVGDPLATLTQVERIRSNVAMPNAATPAKPAPFQTENPHPPISDAPFNHPDRRWPSCGGCGRTPRKPPADWASIPEVLIAQAAHETAWGRSVPRFADGRTSHNLFGIKASRGWDGERVVNSTFEFVNGVAVRQRDGFRAYPSYADSFNDYVRFLQVNPRYTQALILVQDGSAYLRELQRAGYATDPNYARKFRA